MKIVIDTNIIISAFITQRHSLDFLMHISNQQHITLITCRQMIEELVCVLSKDKFNIPPHSIKEIIQWYLSRAVLVYVDDVPLIIKDDPADNIFLACANEGNADYIITGDNHLLAMKNYKKTKIIKQSEFIG